MTITKDSPVLIVDDSVVARRMICDVVSKFGFTAIDQASSAALGLEKIEEAQKKKAPFRLIFVDWSMPVMDGLTFLRTCRSDPLMSSTAIIMCTSVSEQNDIVQAFDEGVTAFVTKPFKPINIIEAIEQAMSWARNTYAG